MPKDAKAPRKYRFTTESTEDTEKFYFSLLLLRPASRWRFIAQKFALPLINIIALLANIGCGIQS